MRRVRGTPARSAAVPDGMSGRKPGGVPRWDPPITIALLLAGLLSVTQVVAAARDLPAFLDETYTAAGMGRFTDSPAATAIGYAIVVVQMAALVAAIGVSVPRLRAHRMAFWVPLLAASACTAITVALLFVAVATGHVPGPTTSPTPGA
jgi:hypothetical protein